MKKRVLSALLALCLTLSLAGAAFAENETLSPAQETSVSESASSAAEPQEEKESEVEAEEVSTAETAQEPSYPAQDFEAAVDGADNMTVNVSAPEGALPEGVTLISALVGSSEDDADDQAVADVAAELDDAKVEYDGFVALDISFVDADGNKVEPLQPVSVNFTLPAELLPEDVDASTLEVQHLKENEAGEVEAVETVADATEGTVTVDGAAVVQSEDDDTTLLADAEVAAEFTVDSFSAFTVSWRLVRQSNNVIQSENVITESNTPVTFSGNTTNGTEASVTVGKTAIQDLNNKSNYELTLSVTGEQGQQDGGPVAADIMFIIDRSSSMWADYGDGSGQSRMDALKSAVSSLVSEIEGNENIDARYSAVQFGSNYTPFNIPIYSHDYNETLLHWTDSGSGLVEKINGIDKNIEEKVMEFFGDASGVGTNMQAGISLAKRELSQRDTTRKAKTYVILISDGAPSHYYNSNGREISGTTANATAAAVSEIESLNCDYFYAIGVGSNFNEGVLTQVKDAVPATTDKQVYSASNTSVLEQAFHDIVSDITFFSAKNVEMHDTLSRYADVVLNENKQVLFTVKLETQNPNGEWVSTDENTRTVISGNATQFSTITTDSEGNATTTQVIITPTYNNKEITVTLDGDSGKEYELAPGYRYSVSLPITASADAIEETMDSVNAKNTPEPGTGTHADTPGQVGFWSNEEGAKVTYKIHDTDGEAYFKRPVIQVPTTPLTIYKEFKGLDGVDAETLESIAKNITFKVEAVIDGSRETVEDGLHLQNVNGKYQITTTKSLTVGKEYIVTETYVSPDAYNVSPVSGTSKNITVAENQNTITFMNTYTPKARTLTVTKTVTGSMASNSDDFTFQLTLEKTGSAAVDNGPDTLTVHYSDTPANITNRPTSLGKTTGRYEFPLRNGETVEITIPYGYTAALTEVGLENTGYQTFYREADQANSHPEANLDENGKPITDTGVTGHYTSGNSISDIDMSTNHVYQFVNFRPVVAPTGLEDNHTKPFGLMVGVAVLAGLALVGGTVVRRRRRWME